MRQLLTPLLALAAILLGSCEVSSPGNGNNSFRLTLSTDQLSLKTGASASVTYSVISESPDVSVSILPVDGIETTVKPMGDGRMGEITLRALPGSEGSQTVTVIASDGNFSSKASLMVIIEKSAKKLKEWHLEKMKVWVFHYDDTGRLSRVSGEENVTISYNDESIIITSQEGSKTYQSIFALKDGLVVSALSAYEPDYLFTYEYDSHRHLKESYCKSMTGSFEDWADWTWNGDDCLGTDHIQIQYGDQPDLVGISTYFTKQAHEYGSIDFIFVGLASDGVFPPRSKHLPTGIGRNGTIEERFSYTFDADGYPLSMFNPDSPNSGAWSFTYYE